MTKEMVYRGIADILEVGIEKMRDNEELSNFEAWNSLSVLAYIAFVDENLKLVLNPKELKNAKQIGDLIELVRSKLE